MTGRQIEIACAATPFRPFELMLADQRTVLVEQPDLIVPTGDGSLVTIYQQPADVEIIDLTLVVSIRFRVAGLFDDSILEA
jgi:hypothetical protein